MRQGIALALLACNEQDCSHGSGHTRANSGNVALYELHRVVDAQSCMHAAARRVYVDVDVLARVGLIQVEELSLQGVSRVVVNLRAKEYDAVHHQAREDVDLGNIQLPLFQDVGVEVLVLGADDVVQNHTVNPKMLGCVFLEIVH